MWLCSRVTESGTEGKLGPFGGRLLGPSYQKCLLFLRTSSQYEDLPVRPWTPLIPDGLDQEARCLASDTRTAGLCTWEGVWFAPEAGCHPTAAGQSTTEPTWGPAAGVKWGREDAEEDCRGACVRGAQASGASAPQRDTRCAHQRRVRVAPNNRLEMRSRRECVCRWYCWPGVGLWGMGPLRRWGTRLQSKAVS